MILNILLYIIIFLNCFVMIRIINTDCSNVDLMDCCKLAMITVSLDTTLLIGFTIISIL